jgi:hypothetical protein
MSLPFNKKGTREMNYALTPEQKKDLQGAIQEISN